MMRKAEHVLAMIIIIAIAGLWLFGCGSSDLLDENNQRYMTSISFRDFEEEDMITIDTRQVECDGNITIVNDGGTNCVYADDALFFDDLEPFGDVVADITITVDENAPGITLSSYTIDYFGEASADGTGAIVMPPDLSDLGDEGTYNISIPSGSSGTFTLTCMTIDTKQEYNLRIGNTFTPVCVDETGDGVGDFWVPIWTSLSNLDVSRYTIRFTLYFTDEYLVERQLTIERTIYLGDYNLCE